MANRTCYICQKNIDLFSRVKILDGTICSKCFNQRPPYLSPNPKKLTLNQFKELHVYQKERIKLVDKIEPTTVIAGDRIIIAIDDLNDLFAIINTRKVISSIVYPSGSPLTDILKGTTQPMAPEEIDKKLPRIADDFVVGNLKVSNYNPSVFYTNEVIGFSTQIKRFDKEIRIAAYKYNEYNTPEITRYYSFTPPCYATSYCFFVDIFLRNQFQSHIGISLNNNHLPLYKDQEEFVWIPRTEAFFKSLKPYAAYNGKRDNDFIVRNSDIFTRYSNYVAILHNYFDERVSLNKKVYCGMCGAKLTGDKKFCPQCGNAVKLM